MTKFAENAFELNNDVTTSGALARGSVPLTGGNGPLKGLMGGNSMMKTLKGGNHPLKGGNHPLKGLMGGNGSLYKGGLGLHKGGKSKKVRRMKKSRGSRKNKMRKTKRSSKR